jgi:hypothetical protein
VRLSDSVRDRESLQDRLLFGVGASPGIRAGNRCHFIFIILGSFAPGENAVAVS